MAYKTGFFGGSTGNTKQDPATSGMVLDTYQEADDYGRWKLLTWWGPEGHVVLEVPDEPNYSFIGGKLCPLEAK